MQAPNVYQMHGVCTSNKVQLKCQNELKHLSSFH